MKRASTYAELMPDFINEVVGLGHMDAVSVYFGSSRVMVQHDVSNCGVLNVHYPPNPHFASEADLCRVTAWLLSNGFGHGYPFPRKEYKIIDDVEYATSGSGACEPLGNGRWLLRMSGPYEGACMEYCRWVQRKFPGMVSFTKGGTNHNSGNHIISCAITLDEGRLSIKTRRKLERFINKWRLS